MMKPTNLILYRPSSLQVMLPFGALSRLALDEKTRSEVVAGAGSAAHRGRKRAKRRGGGR
jgi:hypothetical protein